MRDNKNKAVIIGNDDHMQENRTDRRKQTSALKKIAAQHTVLPTYIGLLQ